MGNTCGPNNGCCANQIDNATQKFITERKKNMKLKKTRTSIDFTNMALNNIPLNPEEEKINSLISNKPIIQNCKTLKQPAETLNNEQILCNINKTPNTINTPDKEKNFKNFTLGNMFKQLGVISNNNNNDNNNNNNNNNDNPNNNTEKRDPTAKSKPKFIELIKKLNRRKREGHSDTEDEEKNHLKFIKCNYNFEDKDKILKIVRCLFFMKKLDVNAYKDIVQNMKLCIVEENKVIYDKGTYGYFFYIIQSGEVQIIGDKREVLNTYRNWDFFGENALIQREQRTNKAICTKRTTFWVLSHSDFKKIIKKYNEENFEEINEFLNTISFFNSFDANLKKLLSDCLIMQVFEQGKAIIKEGEKGGSMFIIKEGEVECILKGKVIRTLEEGDIFGEKSILINCTRTCDIVAKTDCICYSLSNVTLSNVLGYNYQHVLFMQFIHSAFAKSEYLNGISYKYLDNITCNKFKEKNVGFGQVAYPKGYVTSSRIVVIIDGALVLNDEDHTIVSKRGHLLYDKQLKDMSEETTKYDLIAEPDCLLVEIETEKFLNSLGFKNFEDILEKSNDYRIFTQTENFSKLPIEKLDLLFDKMQPKVYEQGETIYPKEREDIFIFFVITGKVKLFSNYQILNNKSSAKMFGGDIRSTLRGTGRKQTNSSSQFKIVGPKKAMALSVLFNEGYDEKEKAVADFHKTRCLLLRKQLLIDSLDLELLGYLKKEIHLFLNNNVDLKDLEFYDEIDGFQESCFSLVKSRISEIFYNIMRVQTKMVVGQNLFEKILMKKQIYSSLDSPFTIKLLKTFVDQRFVFFLLEYIDGVSLSSLLYQYNHDPFTSDQLRFYFANLLVAISLLHDKKIIFRSLNPENIIVNNDGYLVLSRFPYAKIIKDKTNTFIDEPNYMSPEVIIGEDYSFEVDIWSLGVVIYEIAFGRTPFGDSNEDPMSVYFNIINGELQFPEGYKDRNLTDLIQLLLNKNQVNRLIQIEEIKKHVWFEGFEWKDISLMKSKYARIYELRQPSPKNKGSYTRYLIENFEEWNPHLILDQSPETKEKNDKYFSQFKS